MLDRRELLLAGASAGALAAFPVAAQAPGGSAELAATFDQLLMANLRRRPEMATQLGVDKGANAFLRSQLSDESDAGRAATRVVTVNQIRRLEAIDAGKLNAFDKLNLEVVLYTARSLAAVQAFDFGGGGTSPYVVSQNSGVYQTFPDFLDTRHPIETGDDAEAYLARMRGFAVQVRDQTERLQHDFSLGVLPPDFILDLTIDQMRQLAVPADQSLLVRSIARRAAAKGLDARYAAAAAYIYKDTVLPALMLQLQNVEQLRRVATKEPGIWRFDQGPEFYEVALNYTTTTRLSPEEVHKFGLDQARAISARLDVELRKLGMTTGTVGQRLAGLYRDPAQLYPNTDEGKQAMIAYCNARLAAIRGRLPRAFSRMPSYGFEVRRVPPQTEVGAPSSFSQPPALDGSRPGILYINLRDSGEWLKLSLATTVFHEGLPGHQLEGGLALSSADLPLIRKSQSFPSYTEGWALYAEQVADEIGVYDDDPYGRIGYLKAQLLRANRCVVDTGIHHQRWGYEQAWRYFVEQEGEVESYARREVERYCTLPGQACSYKLGHSAFVELRDKAKAKLGPKFDIKAYHDDVLAIGRVPLDILRAHGETWIAAQKA